LSSNVRIDATGLGKRYRIDHRSARPVNSLRDALAGGAARLARRILEGGRATNPQAEEFWALQEVDFKILEGERIGIIGRNGAGKSTLLKILGRVTEPTTGRVTIRGRLASLLEVGTGFHPELTGRENIYLNGAVLGMKRAEIQRKLDAIVDFAEIERFLETPVKRYSSGMYVRLAFAVAAHLDADILVVDEVLAVGDIQFQKKCLQKMDSVATDGRTVLLVSHNMSTILGLSTRCMLLEAGRVVAFGEPASVIQRYQHASHEAALGRTDLMGAERYGSGAGRFRTIAVTARGRDGAPLPYAVTGCDLEIVTEVEAREALSHSTVGVTLYDELGIRLVDANTLIKGQSVSAPPGARLTVRFVLRNIRLKPDLYTVGLWLGVPNQGDWDGVRYASTFRMEANRDDVRYSAPFPGFYACEFDSQIEPQLTVSNESF
jgi:lipopolysaccharide transport system ATP-binding protein